MRLYRLNKPHVTARVKMEKLFSQNRLDSFSKDLDLIDKIARERRRITFTLTFISTFLYSKNSVLDSDSYDKK
jgi:hypothetical protein